MRRVVKPLEALLTTHKRIVLKDSAVSWLACEGRREGEGGLGRVFAWVVTVSLILTVCLSLCTGECRGLRSQGSSAWGVAV